MAIAYLGSETFEDSDGTWANNATLPAGTDCVVVVLAGYNTPAMTVTSISLGGTSLGSADATYASTGFYSSDVYHQVGAQTGTKAFACVVSSAWEGGGYAILFYFSGVDQATPIRHALCGHVEGYGGTVTLTLTSVAGDVCLIGAVADSSTAIDVDLNSQTKISEDTEAFNSAFSAAAYKSATGITCAMQATGDYVAGAGCSLIPAAGAPPAGSIAAIVASENRRRR